LRQASRRVWLHLSPATQRRIRGLQRTAARLSRLWRKRRAEHRRARGPRM